MRLQRSKCGTNAGDASQCGPHTHACGENSDARYRWSKVTHPVADELFARYCRRSNNTRIASRVSRIRPDDPHSHGLLSPPRIPTGFHQLCTLAYAPTTIHPIAPPVTFLDSLGPAGTPPPGRQNPVSVPSAPPRRRRWAMPAAPMWNFPRLSFFSLSHRASSFLFLPNLSPLLASSAIKFRLPQPASSTLLAPPAYPRSLHPCSSEAQRP
jgi:hypothetical protein